MLFSVFASLLLITYQSDGVPIDNGVEGEPEIECSSDSITVNFNTRNDFQGHVYVKGRFNEDGCRSDEKGRRVAGMKLGFSACGTKRDRSLNPKGVFVSNTLVITFHPQFLTKVDRAYTIQCFYMEADKTVSQELEVSEITTAFQTQVVPMPVCRYDILDGTPTGQLVKFASIGQQVYHKWTCETEAIDIFCSLVHSCFVDDGAGNRVQLLNEQGCALDRFLLNNLEYQSDLMAGHEAHVFKYADKPALVFQCQITILVKEPGQPCVRPQCPEPGGPGPIGGGEPAGTRPPVPALALASPITRLLSDVGSATHAAANSSTEAPRANGTRRDSRPIQLRRDFSEFASRLLRRVRSIRSAVEEPDALGTWDVTSQSITALDIDDAIDNADILKSIKVDRSPENQNFVQQSIFDFDHRRIYCLSPISLGCVMGAWVLALISGIIAVVLFCRKKRYYK